MRRTLIQIDDEVYRKLRQMAFRQERSISALVRDMIAAGLEARPGHARPSRLSQFASVNAGRSKQGRLAPISEKHDQALADAIER